MERVLPALVALILAAGCAQAQAPGTPSTTAPTIDSLSPSSGRPGTVVTVMGQGFAREGNTLKFGGGYIKNVASADGRTLRFTVPATLDECPLASMGLGMPCAETHIAVEAGAYAVMLVSASWRSNGLQFKVQEP